MTLLEKAKLDGHYIVLDNEGREFVQKCPHILGYEPRSESILFCVGHRCHECWSREYGGGPVEADEQTAPDEQTDPIKSTTRESILKEAITCTCTDRNLQYGGPEDSFSLISEFWTLYINAKIENAEKSVKIAPEDVAIMMGLLKVARLCGNPKHIDSWIDACGYFACGGELSARNLETSERV